jgi:hypothetical protein
MLIGAVGRGLAAGVVGTTALTLAERAEMALTGREPSTVPGQVGARLTGQDAQPGSDAVERLNPVVHWGHGVGMGVVRAGLEGAGRRRATLAFFPMVWAGDAMLYRLLGIAQSPWRWSRRDLATDLFGKAVLAGATSAAFIALDRRS